MKIKPHLFEDYKEQVEEACVTLKEIITNANIQYYVLDTPELFDEDYDKYVQQYIQLQKILGVELSNTDIQQFGVAQTRIF